MTSDEPSDRGAAERDPRLMRVSHDDRDRMVEILRDAAAEGRLDIDELEERVELALTARTFADLEPLAEDLPVPAPAPPAVRASAPAARAEGEAERWRGMGQRFRREGAWRVPLIAELESYGASVRLDYTVAQLPPGGRSELRLSTMGGSVRLTLPPWIAADLTGVDTYGGRIRDNASRHAVPGTATHVLTVTGETHGGSVRVDVSNTK
ncbi:DUF1707 domain-containing protein [Streptomyces sp. NPDC008150]|uniref:DUF1707 SHOCT-like domain-containing protein n=1 Tax=Streptomyces sp. NPDC008150 TaxID=3364816 RepID=UPI0036F0E11A